MINTPDIFISEYNYELPDYQIAKYPLKERDLSKLLFYNGETIEDKQFKELPSLLSKNDLLIFNNTKVIQARLHFTRKTGAKIEIFCLEPLESSDYESTFQAKDSSKWKCIVGNLKKWKEEILEQNLYIDGNNISLTVEKLEHLTDSVSVIFRWNGNYTFSEILDAYGKIPIPPYLNRDTEDIDIARYQTIYSKHKGSVAAPTAGLHFTPCIIEGINRKGINISELTLHVGAGTFKPVKSENVANHEMHIEHFSATLNSLETIKTHLGNIIAVGTTSLRTLESIFWYGVRIIKHGYPDFEKPIGQWEPYLSTDKYSSDQAIDAIINYMKNNNITFIHASTQIIITQIYKLNMIKGLVTNFHQPQSTLLLLISSLVGSKWKEIYQHALDNNYRFLSYGDSSLLMLNKTRIL